MSLRDLKGKGLINYYLSVVHDKSNILMMKVQDCHSPFYGLTTQTSVSQPKSFTSNPVPLMPLPGMTGTALTPFLNAGKVEIALGPWLVDARSEFPIPKGAKVALVSCQFRWLWLVRQIS